MTLLVTRSGSGFIVGGNSAIRAKWCCSELKKRKSRKKSSKAHGAERSGFPIQTPSVKHLGTVPNVWVMFGSPLPSGLFPWGEYSLGEKRNGRRTEDKLPFSPMIYIWSEYPCSIFFTWNVSWTCCFNMRQSAGLSEECPWRLKTVSQ